MKSQSNIGAGKTEIVLSTIYWLLTNLVRAEGILAYNVFMDNFSEMAVVDALEMMHRNQDRPSDDIEEEGEKYALSMSIVNFFKALSMDKTKSKFMYKIMQGHTEKMKQILFAEQERTKSRFWKKIGLELEDTGLA